MTADIAARAAMSLGAILTVAGGGILVVTRGSGRPVWRTVLGQRWLTWAVLGPLWLAAAAWVPARVVLLTALAMVAASEYARMRPSLVRADRWMLIAFATFSTALVASGTDPLVVVICGVLGGIVLPILSQDIRNGPERVADFGAGVTLVVAPFMLLFALTEMTSGTTLFVVGLAVALSDVTAFVLGTTTGRRKLAPTLSPNKTYAGLVGNVAGAVLGLFIVAAVGIAPWSVLLLGPVIGLCAVFGDLLVSMVKRSAGVKDAGTILPGFGGLLDRVDSLLVTAPVLFVVASAGWIAA